MLQEVAVQHSLTGVLVHLEVNLGRHHPTQLAADRNVATTKIGEVKSEKVETRDRRESLL